VLRWIGLSVLVGTSIWFEQSTFVPFASDRAIHYVLCTPALWRLAVDIALIGTLLGGLCLVLEQTVLVDTYSDRPRLSSSDLFSPLALVAANLLSAGLLRDSLRDGWAPVAYVGSTLYPFVWAAASLLIIWNVYVASSATFRESVARRWMRLDVARQSLLIDVAIAVMVAGIVITTSPRIRFSGTPVGDEPKYLRYAENWWQGRGMDMDGVQDASDIPASKQGPRFLHNFSNLVPALHQDVSQLIADASYLGNWKHWNHQFNKATYVGNWFVTGKNGGLYQIHQPGISVLILPAYAIDRWLFDTGRGRLADDLFAANMVMLLIYLVLAVVTFRLVDGVVQHRGVAAVATIACLASLPLASFVFQFYPETLGAVLVAAVVHRSLSANPLSRAEAVGIGLALGWLVWLQVRFAVLAGTLFLWVLWTFRRDRRTWLLIAVSGGVVGLFCFYVYHVTGSVLPSALYDATPDPGFRVSRLPAGLVGVLFDRENGMFALGPLFLLALPGLGVMLRQHRRAAFMVVTLFLALLIPVAGHGYETSGTSPLRHMVAVIPLTVLPIAAWLRSMPRRSVGMAIAGVLMLMSIQMAAAYNLHNDKTITQTIAAGVSGWDPSLAFPLLRRVEQPGFDARALAALEAFSVLAVAAGFWIGLRPGADEGSGRPHGAVALAISLAIVAGVGCLAVYSGGPRRELRLLETPRQALRECQANCVNRPGSIQIGTPPAE